MTHAKLLAAASLLIVLAAMYFGVLLATGALATDHPGRIGQLDLQIARFFFDLRSDRLVQIFTVATAFGNWGVIFLFAVSTSVVLWLTRRHRYIPALWLVLIGNQTLVTMLKGLFLRPRPEYVFYREVSASFPSGHSAASFALFGFLTYILVRENIRPRAPVLIAGLVIVMLVGSSRLVLGEHYLSDVLSGYLVGAVWVALGICLTEIRYGKLANSGAIKPRRRLSIYAVMLCTSLALYFTVENYVRSLKAVEIARPEQSNIR